jgi:beta-lactamase regulating signal transducer with metallopeptidase domain
MNITALDISLSSHFLENSTIEDLLDELMVEKWNSSIMYEDYFNECKPTQCTYTHQSKNNAIYIVTTIIGLIGGLTTALKLIVPRLVMVARKKKEVQRSQNGKTISNTGLCILYKLNNCKSIQI